MESQEKKKRSWATWLVGIILLLVLYVGSTGPVLYATDRGYFGQYKSEVDVVCRLVYYPIIYGVKHSKTLSAAWLTWIGIWV